MPERRFWKDHILAVPSSLTWVVEVKDEPDLILPDAWRTRESPLCPRCPFQHRWGSLVLRWLLHRPCSWQQGGGGTGAVHGRWRATLAQPGHRRTSSGPQLHWRHSPQEAMSLLFLIRNNTLQGWHCQSSGFTGKNHSSSSNLFGRSGGVWQRCDAGIRCTFGSDQAALGEVGLVLWADMGQLAILGASCWKNGLSVCLSVPPFCLSVCPRSVSGCKSFKWGNT